MITQEINLNMIPDSEPVIVRVNQYDTGIDRLKIYLYDGNVPYMPASGSTVCIQGTKPDGHGFQYTAQLVKVTDKNKLPNRGKKETIGGVTFEPMENGTIVLNGVSTRGPINYDFLADSETQIQADVTVGNSYILNGCNGGGPDGASTYYLWYQSYNTDGQGHYGFEFIKSRDGDSPALEITSLMTGDNAGIHIDHAGIEFDNLVISPMLRKVGDSNTYIPFSKDNYSYVLANVTQQMTAVAGDVRTQIVVTEPGGKTGTFVFILKVQESALNDETDVSDTEIPAIIDAAEHNAERAEQAAADAEEWVTKAPYIDPDTCHWFVFDVERHEFVDTGINADGNDVNYNNITNKPKINNVEVSGNKTSSDFGLASASDVSTINSKIPSTASSSNKMATASDITSLSGDISAINGKIPSNASSSNKMAVASDITAINGNITTINGDISAINGKIPSNASSSNKMATASDITSVTGDISTINGKIPSNASSSNKMAVASDITAINDKIPSGASSSNKMATASDITAINNKIPSNASSSNKLSTASDLSSGLATKQNTLTFDAVPTANSNNPVKSGGVYSAISAISSLKLQVVQTLPTTNIKTDTIYLVPKTGSTGDVYNEYIYINNAWELIGNTETDLSGYVTDAELSAAVANLQPSNTAVTHTASTAVGASNKGVYVASNGVTTAMSYEVNKTVPSDAKFTDTTYESKAAASGGTAVSLVTTGEKYTWNNKADNTTSFTEASTRANIASGETMPTILGKIKKFFTDLKTVAFTGSYNDLSNKPTIPAAQVNSDWNASSGVAQILNKPTIPAAQVNSDWNATSGKAQILNKPTIPAAQIQSDWNQTTTTAKDYIKNKPTIPSYGVVSTSANGLAPKVTDTSKYLKGDGTWATPTNTWTAMVGATSSANGSVGYVNAVPPKDGYNTKYLRADGSWQVPSATDSNAYHSNDTAETTLADDDKFPFYDTSASAKRSSTWSNVKAKLKTYFDTLYSTVTSRQTPASGGTTLSLVNTGDMYNWNNKKYGIDFSYSVNTISSTQYFLLYQITADPSTLKTPVMIQGTFGEHSGGALVQGVFTAYFDLQTSTVKCGGSLTGRHGITDYSNIIATRTGSGSSTITRLYAEIPFNYGAVTGAVILNPSGGTIYTNSTASTNYSGTKQASLENIAVLPSISLSQTVTLSATDTTTVTFTDYRIAAFSRVEVFTGRTTGDAENYVNQFNYDYICTQYGSCVIKFPPKYGAVQINVDIVLS